MGDNKQTLLQDEYKPNLKLVESKAIPKGPCSGAVLATLFGTLSDWSECTRNDRWYTGSLWKRVLDDPLFKEALQYKALFGEPDHPFDNEERLETHIPYVSHIIREPRINEAKQCVEGYIDILDTDNGRILKTLLDYGTTLGVSSRGAGDLTSIDGKTVVDENTYTFITWDVVARPSNRKARVHEIDTVDSSGRTAFESMASQIKSMIESGDKSSLKLTESLVTKTENPDKDKIVKMIREGIEQIDNAPVLEPEIPDTMVNKSDLDEAYKRILELKSELNDLKSENSELKESIVKSEDTIEDLTDLNKNLNSMVKSYMEEIASMRKNPVDTIEGESTIDAEEYTKKVTETIKNINIDTSPIEEAVNTSSKKILTQLTEVLSKLREYDTNRNLMVENQKLSDSLSESIDEITNLKESLKKSKEDNIRMIRKTSLTINEYFKLRCSQLGLNESVARKEFNNRLYEYDLSDINEILTELYTSQRSTQSSNLNESVSNTNQLGSVQLVGSIRTKSNPLLENTDDENDEEFDYSELVESIRNSRNM